LLFSVGLRYESEIKLATFVLACSAASVRGLFFLPSVGSKSWQILHRFFMLIKRFSLINTSSILLVFQPKTPVAIRDVPAAVFSIHCSPEITKSDK